MSEVFDPRAFGARGDGAALDTQALNRAVAAAASAGGGVVRLGPGTYLSHSIRLQSRVRLYLEKGAVLLAADPPAEPGAGPGYDLPEASIAATNSYQDFGHSHWRNSLISGIGLEDIAIEGPGLIWGRGLVNGDYEPGHLPAMQAGVGNKAIALYDCRRVTLAGVSILEAGHFAVLATGCRDLAIARLTIDTNRDGINLDCCRDVEVSDCRINSPNDDAICLKSTFALGRLAATEDVRITGCTVSGSYQIGSLINGSRTLLDRGRREVFANVTHRTGRIKLGTESTGGFRRIRIENCIFQRCRGLALETVDGGDLEDVRVAGLMLRQVRHAPIFIRLGARLSGPEGVTPGRCRGITIRDVRADQPWSAMPVILAGIAGHRIEDVTLADIHLRSRGGAPARLAAVLPPEAAADYPDPEMFGVDLPAAGLFARHVRGLTVRRFRLECARPDARPLVWARDVRQASVSAMGR
ncbi:MAG TPA: right-handed parallel beta-helix repeat-containing protein [Acidisoma sp.]|uniref:rhamnogalacturonidase n=1 Tax=Acidisoma sp. TaxID=1872115 RepID=UPI002C50D9E2|nr:right-handed parallel beta-helix repeat-containing protein [Acidisoma sp.]HTI02974.1 right-handed parallel beta-helix repeat-containing protein [Acidisoma sp.]